MRYRSRRQLLDLTPVEFLARLTLHIPDRYQNIRRYAGFYSSVVQRRVRAARCKEIPAVAIDEGRPVKPSWANLIAKIFGAIPIQCPKCGAVMELAGFILDAAPIAKLFPDIARAPPRKQFERYVRPEGEIVYGHAGHEDCDMAQFSQVPTDDDAVFNQENSW